MSERILGKEKLAFSDQSLILVPFYTDPAAPQYSQAVGRFGSFLAETKDATGLRIVVVDDGCGLTESGLGGNSDLLLHLPQNRGKAAAVRKGLETLLTDDSKHNDFIVQYDGDYDQSPKDMPVLHQALISLSKGSSENPTLVIGDRYAEGLQVPPNPESVDYRRSVLYFFGKFSRSLGIPEHVRDWASGARGYTREYARAFLNSSSATGYGIECEQHIVASLVGAKVDTAPLTISRPRDTDTLTYKWLQFFRGPLVYAEQLRAQGRGDLVDVMQPLVGGLEQEVVQFDVDLSPIDEMGAVMHFTKRGDRYTMRVPNKQLATVFDMQADYPFTLKKPSI